MERRYILKLASIAAAGAAALAVSAQAAPLQPGSPQQGLVLSYDGVEAVPAVVTQTDVDHLKPEQVRWGHHWHRHHWHRHHWGWGHRRWHRHHW